LDASEEEAPKTYHRDLLTVIPRCPHAAQSAKTEPQEQSADETNPNKDE
jgi:hypothetical protein